ncbi:TPA: DNA cytosine methyltransferase [Pseudomonas aeruginosa]|jgi:DNA (cytosine-5)-methyltransferase 1|nr:DNA cytosine methyltransferase [Pseudomonas aeruginosa]
MRGYYIKNIGQNRGRPRIWLQGSEVSRAGLRSGDSYSVHVTGGSIVLRADPNGDRVVSAKPAGSADTLPIIDINSQELLALFDGMAAIRMVQRDGEIYLSPIPTELRKKDRLRRLRAKLESGQPLKLGSMSHGGGILSHAVHEGLEENGVESSLAWANEIRPELIEHASQRNPLWTSDTIPIAAPMQEFAFDQRAMTHLPQTDIAEAGWPCSGASKPGRAKRGTSMPEEHPEVGHLVVSGLMIIGRANPAIFLLENVVPYSNSASAAILRSQLRDLGYEVHEKVLRGSDFNALENRERWCLVAVTEGLHFSWDMLQIPEKVDLRLSDVLDDIPLDDPLWSEMRGLKAKQERDLKAGKGFVMQVYDEDSQRVGTMRKGYARCGSTDPKLRHPTNPDLLRPFTVGEHARLKQVPEELVEGLSRTVAHEVLGQSVNYEPFRAVGAAVAQCIEEFAQSLENRPANRDELAQAVASELLETAGLVLSEIRKPVRGVRYQGPITVLDLGVAIQDIGNNVGIIYRVDQLITPEGRVPSLGDVVEVVQKLGKRMDVRWLTDQELTPAPCVDLQARLGELGYPPIQTQAPRMDVELETGHVQSGQSYSFEW